MNKPPTERLGAQGKISLLQAVAANVLNMVGIGPFLTIPLILSAMGGPQAMLGWGLGAVIALPCRAPADPISICAKLSDRAAPDN